MRKRTCLLPLLSVGLWFGCSSKPTQKGPELYGATNPAPHVERNISSVSYPPGSFRDKIYKADTTGLAERFDRTRLLMAQLRFKALFHQARTNPQGLFKELRDNDPFFMLPAEQSLPNVYLVTKNEDVKEALRAHSFFTVKTYEKIMDATVGAPYMLGRENHAANAEKPYMQNVLDHLEDGKKASARIRSIVAQLTREAITSGLTYPYGGSNQAELDVVQHVSRAVPLGVNSEYFGFNGPSTEKMAEWSRATQHAFFHNPERKDDIAARSVQAGAEMRAYINNKLIPQRRRELENGRPGYDPVSRMLLAASAHQAAGLSEDRLVPNVIGLLVGSVETTSAAIVQSLHVLMKDPSRLKAAVAAANKAAAPGATAKDQEAFDRYVWEALRFDPINPWVGRIAVADYTLAKGTPRETTIPAGSLVLISLESAMHDEAVFPNPEQFRLNRPMDQYLHLSYDYHRCLGDNVALVMVPETIKQMLVNMPGLKSAPPATANNASENPQETAPRAVVPDFKGGPFPESWIVAFQGPRRAGLATRIRESLQGLGDKFNFASYVTEKLVNYENPPEALKAVRHAFSSGDSPEKDAAIEALPGMVVKAMSKLSYEEQVRACEKDNPKSQEAFPNPGIRRKYCELPLNYRACYLVQRVAGKQSSQHAFNHCAYGRRELNSSQIQQFKKDFASVEAFSFVRFQ